MTLAYIGLGSNLANATGDCRDILQQAVKGLVALGPVRVSGLYASKPMGPQDQPDYLNAVVALDTHLTAHDLLKSLQQLEQQAGRVRVRHWGERTLDLDLLLYGMEQIQTPVLTVPHVGILQRNFVILPLLELDEQLQVNGVPLKDCPVARQQQDICRLADASWALSD
ncbi:2-amino-4-hydroxy-6-hydroxymethyldihydropteridine diphosphokinase [Alkanindiges sp. WGS2144]|uniref:2-amino-4-hydroxy-6- hydroxymethyldihydropteridine diphosphokinase n=1 Tax=Alkanindiges sp. WGS2144 TaxID=3366808 RepID=UPI0037539FA2